nr:hypothetical protein [Tanacetum cinerariifolium]
MFVLWGFIVCDPNKTPDSSQRPPQDCPKCGNPVDGLYCRHCALLRKKLKEVWFTICDEHNFFQDFLNTSESSNDDSNVVDAPQEPIVFNLDPSENSSQSPPHIDHHCCYGCGDPLDEPCHNQNVDELPQTLSSFHPTCYSGNEDSFSQDSTPKFVNDSPNVFNPPPEPPTYSYEFCGNDAQYSHDCPPQVPCWDRVSKIKNALGNKQYKPEDMQELFRKLFNDVQNIHEELTEYINIPSWNHEVIKSSVEDLVPIPSESEGILDNTCDVPFRDNSSPLDVSKDQFEEFFDSNDDSTLIDDDYFSIDNIDYVEASPPDSELVSLDGEIEDDILQTSSGSTTTHTDYSLPKYDSFIFKIEPDQGELTSVVMEDNLGEPRVHVPNVLPTHPTLMLDSDFIPFDNYLPKSEIFYFDIEKKNSGSTIIHADISLSDLEYFNFKNEPDPGELTSIVDFGIRENILPATNVNLSPDDYQSLLFAYVVWIFLSFLTYPIVLPYLLSSRNDDTIFDPSISNYHFSSFMPGLRLG